MSDSIWKKEISFKKKKGVSPAPVQSAAPVPSVAPATGESVWKKEISFGRKPKVAEPVAEEPVPDVPPVSPQLAAKSESVWKKEISFGRKPKPAEPAAVEPAAVEPVAIESAPADDAFPWVEQKERWWNKEIGGSRKPAPPAQPAAFEAVEPIAPIAPIAPPVPAPAPAPEPEPVAELPVFAPEQVDPAIQGLYESVVSQPVEEWGAPPAVPPAPVEPVEPEAVTVVEPEPEPEPAAEATSMWKKELSFKRKPKQPRQAAETPPAKKARPKLRRPSLSLPSLRGQSHSTEKLVGLKIGGSQIAAARINNNGAAELVQLARMPLQSGIVVGGELRDPEALAGALRTFFSQNKLPRRGVRLGVASSRIGVRVFEISGIADERQFVNAVRFRAQEALPIPLDEAVLDYRVLSEGVNEEGEAVRRVLLVVAHKDLVERYMEACKLAGIQLSGIDLEAFALLRSLAP
ncbi:MAG: pilus assembly protein PilM, partial [Gaiellaceae bacterium]